MIETNKIYNGTCLEVLKTIEDNSLDSCVTDPPYGLNFMNKHWDYDVPKVEVWKEVLRVLKPGGHLLCACGTRTQHRMVCNIEDAGFEIRDVISWIYGSGFPKSLDISKAIDKGAGVERDVIGKNCSKGIRSGQNNIVGDNYKCDGYSVTLPSTDEAKQWNGWGTALKPATEFWTLARKPLSEKTVAENVLKYGTGGINIDGCRIGMSEEDNKMLEAKSSKNPTGKKAENVPFVEGIASKPHEQGRFPANVILDEFMGAELDRQSGVRAAGAFPLKANETENNCMSGKNYARERESRITTDEGGASRFFKNCNSSEQDNFKYCQSCQNKNSNAHNVEMNFTNMQAIIKNIVQEDVLQKVCEKSVLLACNVGSLCEICAIDFVQKVAKIANNSQELQAIQDYITNSKKCTLLLNLVLCVEQMESIDTTPITTSLLKLFGSAYHAIENYIKKDTKVAEEQKLGQSRFAYIPKADDFERNKGLKGLKGLKTNDGRQSEIDNPFQRGESIRRNHHPTVKPIDLMRYLVKLITPKGGICIDPYCGSGTTLIGAKLELINYIGIERELEYCKIAEARIAAWNPDKYKTQTLF